MSQLKMYRLFDTPVAEYELPEGYSFSHFDPVKDVHAWCECLRGGALIDGRTDEQAYRDEIINFHDITPEEDIWFLDYKGEHIGTATSFVHKATNIGDMHQVGIKNGFKGRGLAKYLSQIVLMTLRDRGVRFVSLTTGEGRVPAVKSYLSAGFLPVEYDFGMQKRWENVLRMFGMSEIQMLYEDGTPYKTIYADKTEAPLRIGVFGCGRGSIMVEYCLKADNAEAAALCDSDERYLASRRKQYGDGLRYYTDFDEFIKEDFDCVFLANYANDHAPYAIKALRAGKHVISEVLPCENLKEAVELIETVESSGKRYFFAENCCFLPAVKRITKIIRDGRLGKFEYAEGEYLHNCYADWCMHSHAQRDHWRNTMSAFFYCTHSIGPLIHSSGLRPVSVTGFEAPYNHRMYEMGAMGAPFAMEVITLEDGSFVKSLHGVSPSKYSLWYSFSGSRGVAETGRDAAGAGKTDVLYMDCDKVEDSGDGLEKDTDLRDGLSDAAGDFGHEGSDYYTFYQIVESINGNRQSDVIDVYEAMDMFLPGLYGFFSALEGGKPQAIPDLRDKAQRDAVRNDTRCTNPSKAGDMLLPSKTGGNPEIPDVIYEKLKAERNRRLEQQDKA
ncbi:MAG: Gfo/Idh/MocA family oxidoreductase [Clostridia bacterium]|nr:Gfo/Idh/MocA family oxidoreductase [Clostridia bacterium]